MKNSSKYRCPDCGELLMIGTQVCKECHWDGRKKPDNKKPNRGNGKCEFSHGGLYCPFDGVWSDSTRGGGPWYCAYHGMHQGELGQKFLEYVHKNPDVVLEIKKLRRLQNESRQIKFVSRESMGVKIDAQKEVVKIAEKMKASLCIPAQ